MVASNISTDTKDINGIAQDPPLSSNQIDLAGIGRLLSEQRWILLCILITTLAISTLYYFSTVPIYQSTALISIDQQRESFADLLAGTGNERLEESAYTRVIAIIRSRNILGQTVDQSHRTIQVFPPEFDIFGQIDGDLETGQRAPNFLSALAQRLTRYRKRWQLERPVISVFEAPDNTLFKLTINSSTQYSLSIGDDKLLGTGTMGSESVFDLGTGQKLVIKVESIPNQPAMEFGLKKSSRLAAIGNLANHLTIRESRKGSNVIQILLKGTDPIELSETLNVVVDSYKGYVNQPYAARAAKKLKFLKSQLVPTKARLDVSEEKLNSYRTLHQSVDLKTETKVLLDHTAKIETGLLKIRQEKDTLRLLFRNRHPKIIAVDRQISRFNQQLKVYRQRIQELPNTKKELARLIRDTAVNNDLYTALLAKAQKLEIEALSDVAYVDVVDYAITPENPEWPRLGTILALGTLLGLFLGPVMVIAAHFFKNKVADPMTLSKRFELPVFATVPHSKWQKNLSRSSAPNNSANQGLLAVSHPSDQSLESLRGLLAVMRGTNTLKSTKAIMICSSTPGAGKSFVSSNLAALLSSPTKRVVIVDADLRKGRIHEIFGGAQQPGLSELLLGKNKKVMRRTDNLEVHYISCGSPNSDSFKLLADDRFRKLIDALIVEYDHVIIDTPPLLSVADAMLIGQHNVSTLLVVRQNANTLYEIETGLSHLKQSGANLMGFIVNDWKTPHSKYSYYTESAET